jgi:hypothetical protein
MTIHAQDADFNDTGTNTGGALTIRAGNAANGSAANAGGDLTLQAGDGTGTVPTGGDIILNLQAGANAGNIEFQNDGTPFATFTQGTVASFNDPIQVPSHAVASLPSAATAARIIYVSDETGGATLAFSDGTNWRRVQDRAIVA